MYLRTGQVKDLPTNEGATRGDEGSSAPLPDDIDEPKNDGYDEEKQQYFQSELEKHRTYLKNDAQDGGRYDEYDSDYNPF